MNAPMNLPLAADHTRRPAITQEPTMTDLAAPHTAATTLDRLAALSAAPATRHTPNLAEYLTRRLAAADALNTALHAYTSRLERKLGIARKRVSTLERSVLAALADQANTGNMLDTIEHAADRIGRELAGEQPSLSEVRRQYGRIAQVLADDSNRALAARAALNAEATA